VTIEWRDPVQAADWANTLVARLNAEMRSRAIANTTASVGFLEAELKTTPTVETRQAISRIIAAKINQRMLANITEEYAFRVVDKALPPDPRDMVRPKRPVLLALGPILGLLVGAFIALITGSWALTGQRATNPQPHRDSR
jgi:LPS O-antigen subunit length determinant protein (WzzB/FepE family)